MAADNTMLNLESVYAKCAIGHNLISTNPTGLARVPHVKGAEVSISVILERLYVHGSISAVINYYQDLTEEQIKSALSYASTFMEVACDGAESSKTDRDHTST